MIEASNLSVTYKTAKSPVRVFDGAEFAFTPGKANILLGSNGSGKSTLLKVLCGVFPPLSGTVTVGGCNPHRNERKVKRRIGLFLGSKHDLWWDLPLEDSYRFTAGVYRLHWGDAQASIDRFSDLFCLKDCLSVPVRELSLGQRVKASIVQSLLHDPGYILLDEPTIGLDLQSATRLATYLDSLASTKTLVVATHDRAFVEQLNGATFTIGNKKVEKVDGTALQPAASATVDSVRVFLETDRLQDFIDFARHSVQYALDPDSVVSEDRTSVTVRVIAGSSDDRDPIADLIGPQLRGIVQSVEVFSLSATTPW